ncbi:unnamed protein product [Mytilus edulis]|uniref:PHR domain-containing protein n=1 Tax=Mytilus edulis TaxID=6550 RepID=A0A8S3UUM1_MYTED|nr:unnamed protein product [Mytilus edulis]
MLLTTDEILSVFRYHFGEKCLLFSDTPRCSSSYLKTKYLHRHTSVNFGWRSTAANALTFYSNKSILLKGCIIFEPEINTSVEYSKFTFELTDNSEKVMCNEVLDMQSTTSHNNTIALKLTNQIRLNNDERYTIMVRDIKLSTYYGVNCKSVCNQNGITITFENSPKSKCSTDVNHGQIAGIMFSV